MGEMYDVDHTILGVFAKIKILWFTSWIFHYFWCININNKNIHLTSLIKGF